MTVALFYEGCLLMSWKGYHQVVVGKEKEIEKKSYVCNHGEYGGTARTTWIHWVEKNLQRISVTQRGPL